MELGASSAGSRHPPHLAEAPDVLAVELRAADRQSFGIRERPALANALVR
jgi:hypothetical protein